MLKYKRVSSGDLSTGEETLVDMIAGMAGKNRVIKSIATKKVTGNYLRVYRDAEQIVDFDSDLFTTGWTMLPMDLPLAEGQQVKVGIYCVTTETAVQIVIGYEEAG